MRLPLRGDLDEVNRLLVWESGSPQAPFVWYNLNNGEVTTSWSASAWIVTGAFRFCLLSILSISPGIRLYPVENMETSDGMDSRKRQ